MKASSKVEAWDDLYQSYYGKKQWELVKDEIGEILDKMGLRTERNLRYIAEKVGTELLPPTTPRGEAIELGFRKFFEALYEQTLRPIYGKNMFLFSLYDYYYGKQRNDSSNQQ